ncbi:unknown [Phocaeicola coprophilus CAG:333]|nr:unknown [Phocaeicola coprophilus CAG:333]
MTFESILIACIITNRINTLHAQFRQDVDGSESVQVQLLLRITFESRFSSLYSHRIIFTGIVKCTILVVDRICRILTGNSLNYIDKSIPGILRYATITRSIHTYCQVFIDIRSQVHTGIETRIVNFIRQTVLLGIS